MDFIDKLKQNQENTLSFFSLNQEDLAKRYAPDKWTIRQILHHIVDAETVMYDRIRRVIAEPRQVIWAFRQDDWCVNLNYEQLPLEINQAVFRAVRKAIIYLAEKNYKKNGHKEFIHSETGFRTLKEEFDKILWHNEHHLNQIELALNS